MAFTLAKAGKPTHILMDASEDEGIRMAAQNLSADFGRVTGKQASIVQTPEKETLIVGSLSSSFVKQMIAKGKLDVTQLKGKREKYLLQVVEQPLPGVEKALVIAGSDKRGTIYGIYELSRQMGVSPWYWTSI